METLKLKDFVRKQIGMGRTAAAIEKAATAKYPDKKSIPQTIKSAAKELLDAGEITVEVAAKKYGIAKRAAAAVAATEKPQKKKLKKELAPEIKVLKARSKPPLAKKSRGRTSMK